MLILNIYFLCFFLLILTFYLVKYFYSSVVFVRLLWFFWEKKYFYSIFIKIRNHFQIKIFNHHSAGFPNKELIHLFNMNGFFWCLYGFVLSQFLCHADLNPIIGFYASQINVCIAWRDVKNISKLVQPFANILSYIQKANTYEIKQKSSKTTKWK